MPSLYIAIGLNCIAVLLLLGACWVAIRGLGGISALKSEVIVLTTALEACQERITREVKTRAGLAGAEKAAEERSILEQAQAQLLKANGEPPFAGRPKRPMQRR